MHDLHVDKFNNRKWLKHSQEPTVNTRKFPCKYWFKKIKKITKVAGSFMMMWLPYLQEVGEIHFAFDPPVWNKLHHLCLHASSRALLHAAGGRPYLGLFSGMRHNVFISLSPLFIWFRFLKCQENPWSVSSTDKYVLGSPGPQPLFLRFVGFSARNGSLGKRSTVPNSFLVLRSLIKYVESEIRACL